VIRDENAVLYTLATVLFDL